MLTLGIKYPKVDPVAAKSATGIETPELHERTDVHQRLFLRLRFTVGAKTVLYGNCAGQPSGWSVTRAPIVSTPYSSHPYLIETGEGRVCKYQHEDTIMPPLSVLGTNIRIRNDLYSLNDLHKAAGGEAKHQPSNFLRVEQTQNLIAEIQSSDLMSGQAIEVINGGKDRGTYVCEEVLVAYAGWVDAKTHLSVIRGFIDMRRGNHLAPAPAQPQLNAPAQWYLAKMEAGSITKMVKADVPCIAKYIETHHPEAIVTNKDAMYTNLMQLAKLASDTAAQFRDDHAMEQRWQQLSESVA